MMSIRIDQDLSSESPQRLQKKRIGIKFLFSVPVDGTAVDLERHPFRDEVFHCFESRFPITRIVLIKEMHGVVETGHKIKMTDKSTVQSVIDPRFQIIIIFRQSIIISAIESTAKFCHDLLGIVDRHGNFRLHIQKMC